MGQDVMRKRSHHLSSSMYQGIGYELDEQAAYDYVHNGYLFAPRTVLKGRLKRPYIISKPKDVDLKDIVARVRQTVHDSMENLEGQRRAVMFTGGFDSTFIALLAQQSGAKVTAITVQFDKFNVATVRDAVQAADALGMTRHVINVTTAEFIEAFEALTEVTDEPILVLELALVYAALKKYDRKIAGDVFLSGMGSDHWYGNIALEERSGGFQAKVDWAVNNSEAHQRVAQLFGYRFIFPFLSKSMLELSLIIPDDLKKNKKLLRALAVVNSLPARGAKTELQIPELMKRALIKVFGRRAWPEAVSDGESSPDARSCALRKIVLGLWLEKAKKRPAIYKLNFV